MRNPYTRHSRSIAKKPVTAVVLVVSAIAIFLELAVIVIFGVRMIGESFKDSFGDGTAYLTVVNETDSDIVVLVDRAVDDPLTVGESAADRRWNPDDIVYPSKATTIDVPFNGRKPDGNDYWIYALDVESATVVYFKETTFGELSDSGWTLRIDAD